MFAKAANIAALSALVEVAAADGARLIVTPEMGTTGYCWFGRAEVSSEVETVPGPTTDHFSALAARLDVHIVVGLPEVEPETGLYFNTAVLIGPGGVIGKHRKTHVYISEPKWAAPGDLDHQVFDTPLGKIALLICMDIHFIETARIVALRGADIICHISNWLAERTPAPYWISRAFENGCYLIEANRWGLERTVQFSGGSCIITPSGEIAASIDRGDGVAGAMIDLAVARQARERALSGRRPEMLHGLLSNTFLWNPLDFFGLYGHEPLPPGRASRIAVAQFLPVADTQANLRKIEIFAAQAAADAVDLLVLPELSLTGPYRAGAAELLSGSSTKWLMALASRHRLHIVAGMAEAAGDHCYNTAILAGPQGLIGSYRKIHLTEADRLWASPGDAWGVFDSPAGRIGLLIGQDAVHPESARILALRGCDIIACPSAIPGVFTGAHEGSVAPQNFPIPTGADGNHWHHFRCRGGENNLYFAFSNWLAPDQHYLGKSGVFGPETFAFPRMESAIPDSEGLAALDISTANLASAYPTNVVRRKDMVSMRLAHQYRDLIVQGINEP